VFVREKFDVIESHGNRNNTGSCLEGRTALRDANREVVW
jgi:hypothetical protein